MKRLSSDSQASASKRRKVSHATFLKWKTELDKECQTLSWLDCETAGVGAKKTVVKLLCKACVRFQSKIEGRRNYSDKWISGADSVRNSNIKDHSGSDQHTHAMMLLRKEQAASRGLDTSSYAPIARALHELPESARSILRVKFDIAHVIATRKVAFTNYPVICELEKKHGVNVGTAYLNQNAGKTFCHFIAESRRENLVESLSRANFFSLLMDGSVDSANIDDELFLVLWCDTSSSDEKVHTKMSFFAVARPDSVTAQGLFQCLQRCLSRIGITAVNAEQCKMLVGIGTDGASANIAAAGLKGLVEKEVPWVYWSWCLAHRLELAIKDALKGTSFDLVDDMLLRLHYIYEKSPKKLRELKEVINDLQQCLKFDDAGIKPVRASGSRWVTHKLSAMKRVLSKFGAYTSHLITLSEDSSVKSDDRAKLRGYCSKWMDAKYILGCGFYCDLLLPCAIFSKVMQFDTLDVLGAFTSLLRTVKEVNKLSSKPLQQWPTYSMTLKSITKEGSDNVYQCQVLKKFDPAVQHYSSQCQAYCTSITSCLKSRLAWSDLELVRDAIFVLATQGWQKIVDEEDKSGGDENSESDTVHSDRMESISRLSSRFKEPLEAAGVQIMLIADEFREVLLYATQFISLSTTNYQEVWWKLFNSPSAADWSNILTLAQLLFTLPVSNGKLERVFSTLKNIKVEKRSCLSNEMLDDLLILNTDQVSISDFNPDHSIQLWWNAKTRRLNQKPRKEYRKRSSASTSASAASVSVEDQDSNHSTAELESSEDSDHLPLDDWDNWIDFDT